MNIPDRLVADLAFPRFTKAGLKTIRFEILALTIKIALTLQQQEAMKIENITYSTNLQQPKQQ